MQYETSKPAIPACSSCAAPLASAAPFCEACGRVQPNTAILNYFEFFGLPRRLNIDLANLEKQFYRVSRKLHPDMYARASAVEQEWSLAQSSLLNDAYRTLKNPLSRTEYLLRLEGVQLEEEGKSAGERRESRVPADLLEEVFELNMQLEEMRMSHKMGEDDPQLRTDLENAKQRFEGQLSDADANLEELWGAWDTAANAGDEAAKLDARDKMAALLDRRRYIRNLVRDVNETLVPAEQESL
jgi:molecular chaperone HscB